MGKALVAILVVLATVGTAFAGWDPGGNTPPNATAINQAAGVFQPLEPRADTTREGMIRATGNDGS